MHYARWRVHGYTGGPELWKRADGLILEEKKCTVCKKLLPNTAEYFCTDKQKKDERASRCKKCHSQMGKDRNQELRHQMIEHYSNGTFGCECCGENHYEFLTLDHIHGDGTPHRNEIGTGPVMYKWIINNNFPPMFRVLCHNCNWCMGIRGYCPHEKEKEVELEREFV